MKEINLAIIGATGVVGSKILDVLQERQIFNNIYLFASAKSAGIKITFNNKIHIVQELTADNINKYRIDYALVCAGSKISSIYIPLLISKNIIVIDNSSYYRMNDSVPLIVPGVNSSDVTKHNNIIANPNCSTIQAVSVLKPLHDAYTLKRVVVTTLQAVSGAGSKGIKDLKNPHLIPSAFRYPIYNNVIPQIDEFCDNLNTKEEEKIINETRKILHLPSLAITATCVRVPITNCHSESINLEFCNPINLDEVRNILVDNGIKLIDGNCYYPMPIDADNTDYVYVGRLRYDSSQPNTINMWVVADNIRVGAASNAVSILQLLI